MSTALRSPEAGRDVPIPRRSDAGRSAVGAALRGAALGSALGTTQRGRALLHELAHGYSRALYGEAGAFDTSYVDDVLRIARSSGDVLRVFERVS